MASNGMNMECVDCHRAPNHQMLGRLYSVSSENTRRATCEQCHSNTPHLDNILNRHGAKVSCQACHIPQYAKVNKTKMTWKWSDAGKLRNGQPYEENDDENYHTYLSTKGTFTWQRNVIPEYIWFNGTADHYFFGDTIREVPVKINILNGTPTDKQSKIIPLTSDI